MINFLDLTFPTPAENLACDEALLDWREENGGDEILRFWESAEPFVVVGYANTIEAEVQAPGCESAAVPIFRRCSGGGTVLQGPGCLNYTLILRITDSSPLATISGANKFIMERNRVAIQSVLRDSAIQIQGCTDLAIPATGLPGAHSGRAFRKFSGNSQRRHKNFLLFHGTFLLDFDLALVGKCLKFPSRQPEYREHRSHNDFLVNLNLSPVDVKNALRKVWNAREALVQPPLDRVSQLAREKYEKPEWNRKFFRL